MISEVLEEKGRESTGADPQARRKVEPPAPRPEVRRPPAKPPADRPAPLGESTSDSESFE